ncbi:hypothetical protein LIER_03294 [Lithospermum erythrorhizon]|uniref:Retrotransposon gag domain-containing protein n=1 Tax=Lithospermum erythrorhizon TaxID=34254 RepID=A0AAV3NVF4_LITER
MDIYGGIRTKEILGLAPFSPDIRGAIIPTGLKLATFTKFTGKTDPEEHIVEFQSQMSFHQPDNRVYCRAFPASLVGAALKWFNRLPASRKTWRKSTSGPISISGSRRWKRGPRRAKGKGWWKNTDGRALSHEEGVPWIGSGRLTGRIHGPTFQGEGGAFSRLEGNPKRRKEIKEGKIEYLTPLKTSGRNVFLEMEDRRLLPKPPRHLKIEIEKLIQPGQLKDYVHKETQSVNKRFDRLRSE